MTERQLPPLGPPWPLPPPRLPVTVAVYCGRCGVETWHIKGGFTGPHGVVVAHLEVTDRGALLYGTRTDRELNAEGHEVRRHSPTTALATSGRAPVALRCPTCGPLGSISARTVATRWQAAPYEPLAIS